MCYSYFRYYILVSSLAPQNTCQKHRRPFLCKTWPRLLRSSFWVSGWKNSQHLKPSGGISKHLKASGGVWRHLVTSEHISRHLEASRGMWKELEASRSIWRHREVFWGIKRHLVSYEDILRHLQASERQPGHYMLFIMTFGRPALNTNGLHNPFAFGFKLLEF